MRGKPNTYTSIKIYCFGILDPWIEIPIRLTTKPLLRSFIRNFDWWLYKLIGLRDGTVYKIVVMWHILVLQNFRMSDEMIQRGRSLIFVFFFYFEIYIWNISLCYDVFSYIILISAGHIVLTASFQPMFFYSITYAKSPRQVTRLSSTCKW